MTSAGQLDSQLAAQSLPVSNAKALPAGIRDKSIRGGIHNEASGLLPHCVDRHIKVK
jgi:hypothetical protein